MGSSQSMLSPIGNVMELVYVSFFWKCNSNFFFWNVACAMTMYYSSCMLLLLEMYSTYWIHLNTETVLFCFFFELWFWLWKPLYCIFFFFTYIEVNVFFCWESSFLLCHCPLGFFRPWLLTFPANSVFLSVIVYQLILMI